MFVLYNIITLYYKIGQTRKNIPYCNVTFYFFTAVQGLNYLFFKALSWPYAFYNILLVTFFLLSLNPVKKNWNNNFLYFVWLDFNIIVGLFIVTPISSFTIIRGIISFYLPIYYVKKKYHFLNCDVEAEFKV